jgi:hypothetical protein
MVAFLVMGRGNRASHNKGGPFGRRSTGIKAIDLLMALREFFREFEARGAHFGDEGPHGLSVRVAPARSFSVVGAIQMPNESDNSQI